MYKGTYGLERTLNMCRMNEREGVKYIKVFKLGCHLTSIKHLTYFQSEVYTPEVQSATLQ